MSNTLNQSIPKCKSCKRYLSYFPIYLHEKSGSICGRCPKPTNARINEDYQKLARRQKFPCCNDYACLENLIPTEIPKHEKYCPFKKYACPTKGDTNCEWQGIASELFDHFDGKHVTFLMKNTKFEIDFIHNHNENYLMPYDDNLFIVNRQTNTETQTLSCKLFYVGCNRLVEEYSFKLIFESGNKPPLVITEKLANPIEMNAGTLNEFFKDPTTITVEVKVFYEKPSSGDQEKPISDSFNEKLLKEFECPTCMEYMRPPIIQCLGGHSICQKCKILYPICPTCELEYGNTKNYLAHNIMANIKYPCKNNKCNFSASVEEITLHEKSCIFGPFKCPINDYENCSWESAITNVYTHLNNNHYENLLEVDEVHLPFDGEEDEDCFILRFSQHLFKLHYKFANAKFYWAMQLLGPAEGVRNFKFELDIIDNSGNKLRAYLKGHCSPLCEKDVCFGEDKTYLSMDASQIKHMITDKISFRVRILQD